MAGAVVIGCSSMMTLRGFYRPIVTEVRSQNYAAAVERIDEAWDDHKYAEKDRVLYYLDAGFANHYAGNYERSNQLLHRAEGASAELFTKSISRGAVSLMLNDNALEYPGEDYELIYANLIKALNYLALDDFEDAFVEIRRVNERLELLEDKYAAAARELNQGQAEDTLDVQLDYEPERVRFYNSAFARYLSMQMYAAENMIDDARIDYAFLKEAYTTQPFVYPFEMPSVANAALVEDDSRLTVVSLVGLGPRKEAFDLRLRTDKQLELVQILYVDTDGHEHEYGHLPLPVKADYYFKFSIPRIEPRYSPVTRIRVLADGKEIGKLELLEDVAAVAEETFAARKSLVYLRTIGRAVAKGLLNHQLKKKVDTGGLEGWLKKAAIDVATDLTENADLRCAQLLPGRVFIGDFNLKPGTYHLTVEYYDDGGFLLSSQQFPEVRVRERGLNLVESVFPQ